MLEQPKGLCECGCVRPTAVAKWTVLDLGYVKGQHKRFVKGHHARPPRSAPPNPSGLCHCGCGETTPLARMTAARIGHVKGEHVRFVAGHAVRVRSAKSRRNGADKLRGKLLSPEVRRNMSLAQGGTGEPQAEASHRRLAALYPKTGVCEECGKHARTHYAFKHHPAPHTESREDYRELCPTCHVRFDSWLWAKATRPVRD